MNISVVKVPTINDELSDFDTRFSLWSQINNASLAVTFDFCNSSAGSKIFVVNKR
ncbi:hypothetical protein MBAV_001854 [Candidatus Magnetobacterium bavaricum]|uniref:Uncharacterized protein n=1 Tax=Candidatus Magnetobacterium bavaricum TaxID=29290 RepID=A0A0F3GVE5_9BACT|nr:hypothetical protein MBAV_001854 [Candidatus Magnetobacterium bavaricum]